MSTLAQIDSVFEDIAALIRTRTGLIFPSSRRSDVEGGFRKIIARTGADDYRRCLEQIEADEQLFDELIAEVTIGETYFFREPDHFTFIRETIIPEIRQLRGPEHGLRVWSAGCASGEEPYSLAILFEEAGLAGRARILATDISRAALAKAKQATYSAWSLRGDGARLVDQYLHRSNGRFELAERFCERIEFAYLNLAQDSYPTFATNTWSMDLILCRNVLIYLDQKTIHDVAHRLYESLADGGYLITGPSDPVLSDYAPYEILTTSAGLVHQKPSQSRQPVSRGTNSAFNRPQQPQVDQSSSLPKATIFQPEVRNPPTPPADLLALARDALARGDHARVVGLTSGLKSNAEATVLYLRALSNLGDLEAAAEKAAEAATMHPSSLEIAFLLAVLLVNLGRYRDAARALKRLLYLDRSLAIAQFTLGTVLYRLGDSNAAKRAYRSARDLAAGRPPEEAVPLADGEGAGQLMKAAVIQLALLEPLARNLQ